MSNGITYFIRGTVYDKIHSLHLRHSLRLPESNEFAHELQTALVNSLDQAIPVLQRTIPRVGIAIIRSMR